MNTDNTRKAFQTIYASWAGTLIASGRSDAEITELLSSSQLGLDTIEDADVIALAFRSRVNVLNNLELLRQRIGI